MTPQDFVSVIGALADAIASGLIALYYGFLAFPTGIGFALAAFLALVWGLVTPISFQAETIVLAGSMGKNLRERISIVLLCGVVMTVLGILGLLGAIVDYIGEIILAGMLAGVGVILVRTSIDIARDSLKAGIGSFLSALPVWFLTENLAYTVVVSLIVGTLVHHLIKKEFNQPEEEIVEESDDAPRTFWENVKKQLQLQKPILNSWRIWKAVLAVIALQIGTFISYGAITASMANAEFHVDKLTIMSGLSQAVSSLFGGAPLSPIVSITAVADNPVNAGIAFMAVMALILLLFLLPKIGKLIPIGATAGYLFIIGAIIVIPDNLVAAVQDGNMVGIITFVITAISDPFIGMLAGILTQLVL
ncbi:MAG: NCS2 family permease [Syntrophomonadaceae bacterium]|nr:NCS2 family permease [Syntrophomonadaceae bacterium]